VRLQLAALQDALHRANALSRSSSTGGGSAAASPSPASSPGGASVDAPAVAGAEGSGASAGVSGGGVASNSGGAALSTSGITPAFEWAQSPTHLLLNVKFSHKLDTPATLGCATDYVTVDNRTLRYRATCKAKAFFLQLEALRDLNGTDFTASLMSVGRVQLTLRKGEPGVWPRLTASPKKQAHMHTWWAMHEKHEDDNRAWERKARETPTPTPAAAAAATPTPPAQPLDGEGGGGDGATSTAGEAPAADAGVIGEAGAGAGVAEVDVGADGGTTQAAHVGSGSEPLL
jgi:hypothetical protein